MLLQCLILIAMFLVLFLLLKFLEILKRLQLSQNIGIVQQLFQIVVLQSELKN